MKQSKYDTDGDGMCDAPECKDVLFVTATDRLRQDMVPVDRRRRARRSGSR